MPPFRGWEQDEYVPMWPYTPTSLSIFLVRADSGFDCDSTWMNSRAEQAA